MFDYRNISFFIFLWLLFSNFNYVVNERNRERARTGSVSQKRPIFTFEERNLKTTLRFISKKIFFRRSSPYLSTVAPSEGVVSMVQSNHNYDYNSHELDAISEGTKSTLEDRL